MTQAVQWSQHQSILREAWTTGLRRPRACAEGWSVPDYREEVLHAPAPLLSLHHRDQPPGVWPIHLILWIPVRAPTMWRVLLGSRLVSTLGPQLDAGGYFVRPLCVDAPFILLLWPHDCTWTCWSPVDYLLPLRARLREVLFQMLFDAYHLLWPDGRKHPEALPLSMLLPEMGIFRARPR